MLIQEKIECFINERTVDPLELIKIHDLISNMIDNGCDSFKDELLKYAKSMNYSYVDLKRIVKLNKVEIAEYLKISVRSVERTYIEKIDTADSRILNEIWERWGKINV